MIGKGAATRSVVPVLGCTVDVGHQRARVQTRCSLASISDDRFDDMKRPSTGRPLLSNLIMESQQRLYGHAAPPRCIDQARDLASFDPTANGRVADAEQLARERERHDIPQLALEVGANRHDVLILRMRTLRTAQADHLLE